MLMDIAFGIFAELGVVAVLIVLAIIFWPNPVEKTKKAFPDGSRVELIRPVDSVSAPPVGTYGKVYGVTEDNYLLIHWDNDSFLSMPPSKRWIRVIHT